MGKELLNSDKELLLIDLCSRLYYKVKVSLIYNNEEYMGTLCAIYPEDNRVIIDDLNKSCHYYNQTCGGFLIDENKVKPYLFPLSSMTGEQKEEHKDLLDNQYSFDANGNIFTLQDFYCKYHLDFRGLIDKRCATDATGLNIY